jgi:hypothetical protein
MSEWPRSTRLIAVPSPAKPAPMMATVLSVGDVSGAKHGAGAIVSW